MMVSLCIFLCIYLFRLYVHKPVMHLELIFMCVKKDSNLFPQHIGVWFSQLCSKGLSPLLLCRLGRFTENPLACLCDSCLGSLLANDIVSLISFTGRRGEMRLTFAVFAFGEFAGFVS